MSGLKIKLRLHDNYAGSLNLDIATVNCHLSTDHKAEVDCW